MKKHAIKLSYNDFDAQKALQNFLELYETVNKEKEEKENNVLIEKFEKLTKGKSVILENSARPMR